MRKSLLLMALCAMALAGCGPADPPAANAPETTRPAVAATSTAPAASGITPDRLCSLLSVAQVAQISGFNVQKTKASMSGDVAVCDYRDGSDLGKVIIQYQPNARTMYDFTKSKGEPVSGLGQEAVWFSTAGQLSVRLDAANLFHVFVLDVRMHQNDPKGGSVAIANVVVPQLPHA